MTTSWKSELFGSRGADSGIDWDKDIMFNQPQRTVAKKLFLTMTIVFSLVMINERVFAETEIASRYISNAGLVGKARLKYLVWNVFDAELYAPSGRWSADEPFALTLTYLWSISGEDIVEQSMVEIREQGFTNQTVLADWRRKMARLFQDVSKGTSITGDKDKRGTTIFYRDGERIGVIEDKGFARHFFTIWLGEKAPNRKFREKLIGKSS